MYEWSLLAQVFFIRLVYLSLPIILVTSIQVSRSGRALLIHTYIRIYIHIFKYIHTYMCTYNAVSLYLVYFSGSLSLRKALPMRAAALYMYWPF